MQKMFENVIVNVEKSKSILVIYGGNGVADQFGFGKMCWKLVLIIVLVLRFLV